MLVSPLHRHQPCASALILIRPARFVRSRSPVDDRAASRAAEQGPARPPAPSALVVPPDFDGLLRASPCGLVASRSRPWGSSRFQTPAADREWFMGISHATRGASAGDPFPGTLDPSKLFPCTQPSSGQRVLRLHLSLTPASPTILLLLARPDLSSSPRLASWPFTVGLPLSPLLPRLCHDPFESLLPQALFRDAGECHREPTSAAPPGAAARPQGLPPRTDPLHRQGVSARPVPDASMGFVLCTHRPRGPGSSEEAPSEEGGLPGERGRPAAAVLLRRPRRKRSHPGPT
jgi:hypothetical protein